MTAEVLSISASSCSDPICVSGAWRAGAAPGSDTESVAINPPGLILVVHVVRGKTLLNAAPGAKIRRRRDSLSPTNAPSVTYLGPMIGDRRKRNPVAQAEHLLR